MALATEPTLARILSAIPRSSVTATLTMIAATADAAGHDPRGSGHDSSATYRSPRADRVCPHDLDRASQMPSFAVASASRADGRQLPESRSAPLPPGHRRNTGPRLRNVPPIPTLLSLSRQHEFHLARESLRSAGNSTTG